MRLARIASRFAVVSDDPVVATILRSIVAPVVRRLAKKRAPCSFREQPEGDSIQTIVAPRVIRAPIRRTRGCPRDLLASGTLRGGSATNHHHQEDCVMK